MKALSLWQPWASLMAFEEKKVETRGWSTKFRGEIAIHATAKEPADWLGASRHRQEFANRFRLLSEKHGWGDGYWPDAAHYVALGAVLCVVRLIAIERVEDVRDDLSEQERCFGNYEDGRYAWFTELVERFPKPVPAKGNRMLWNWDYMKRIDKKVCRKEQGIAEPGNTCLTTPGTCESCPNWWKKEVKP